MRYWSILFAAIGVLAVAAFAYAPFDPDWWLTPNLSERGPLHLGAQVDHLFLLILWITGIVFVGTQVALVYATWKYAADPNRNRKATYSHGSKRLELIWTIIPGAILLFLAIYQMGAWARMKFDSFGPEVGPLAQVTARQFQWKVQYPGPDGKIGTVDDLHTINALHMVKGEPVKILLKTEDVLHSFFLPDFRIKQDAVPGLTIPVWFDADEAGTYDLACAELCGWGHTIMRGEVTVHATRADFDDWMRRALTEQNRSQLAPTTETADTEAPAGPGVEAVTASTAAEDRSR